MTLSWTTFRSPISVFLENNFNNKIIYYNLSLNSLSFAELKGYLVFMHARILVGEQVRGASLELEGRHSAAKTEYRGYRNQSREFQS